MKEVAKIYEINPKSLQRWINKGFRKIKGKKKYIKQINIGAGRKIRDSSMEKELLYYYHIVKGGKVTTREFKKKQWSFLIILHSKPLKVGCRNLGKEIR